MSVSEHLRPQDGLDAADIGGVGGKAAGLLRLLKIGVSVPPFWVVKSETFREYLRRGEIPEAIGRAMLTLGDDRETQNRAKLAEAASLIRDAMARTPLDAGLTDEFAVAVAALGPGSCAVRSSMVGEDSELHSFAGQLETKLFQGSAEEVGDAVLNCWRSAFGERALAYMRTLGQSPAEARLAVVVQRMVESDLSGVAFSANPVTGDAEEYTFIAAYGLGEGIVNGAVPADEYVWSPHHGELGARVVCKDTAVTRSESGRGTELRAVPTQIRDQRALSLEQVDELGSMVERIAADAGRPMDVEWCYSGGRLYVLQARPITALRARVAGAPRVFDNANIQESYSGLTTPLTFSFASRVYTTVFSGLIRALGASERTQIEFGPAADSLLGLIDGRVYYNLDSWRQFLELFPGGKRRIEEVESVMWHTRIGADHADRPMSERVRRRLEAVRIGLGLGWCFLRLEARIERFLEFFDSVHSSVDRGCLADADLDELRAVSQRLQSELMRRWDIPNVNDFRVLMSSGRLRRLLLRVYSEHEIDAKLAALLGGIEGIESVKPTLALIGIARDARRDPGLVAALRDHHGWSAIEAVRRLSPPLADRIDSYIARYGDRTIGELKLETVSAREDPSFAVEILRNYLQRPELDPEEIARREWRLFCEARADLSRRLPAWRRPLLRFELDLARRAVKAREALRLRRTLAFGLARDIYRAIGSRLHEAGALESQRDVFYLSAEEVDGFLDGRAVSCQLAAVVALRKSEYARYAREERPHRLEFHGNPYLTTPAEEERPEPVDGGGELLRGIACCAGVVEGPVQVIADGRDELSVNGQIICTMRTDPGWAPLFPTARGLIVERGSTLSHSAILAREFGIPTVVGVPGVTAILRDGDVVRIDGDAGTVEMVGTRSSRAAGAPA